ncbi:ogr/Delta-like zinc finger family protein [Acinetobacter baumannii]|uniref:ogr/Delta-like zinc finger family protein n=1 Tax=Acinetobacter baumannii TaxID=470 RepID=UPI00389181B6
MARPRSRYKCPHCGEPFAIRSSDALNPLLRMFQAQCQNLNCGFTAQGYMELKFQLSPPAHPNPEINLPTPDRTWKMEHA